MIPYGMPFQYALRLGYAGRIECRQYLKWLKEQECATCRCAPPSDPSHLNGWKGMGTKSPDLMAIPQCRSCHDEYERDGMPEEEFLRLAMLHIVQAYSEGRLVWVPQ